MNKNLRFLCISFSLLAVALFATCALHSSGYRLNLSESLPSRIYRVTPIDEGGTIRRGNRVLIDLSRFDNPTIELGIERGYVSRSRKMLKEIGAVPGDIVVLGNDVLYVNSRDIPMTVSSKDSRGKELAPYPTPLVLSPDHYWLISAPYRGFDSRYFGPVHKSAFTHRAKPVF